MKSSLFKVSVAVAVLGTGCAVAQEMGEEAPAVAAAENLPAATPEQEAACTPGVKMEVVEAAASDQGVQIVMENEQYAPVVKAPKSATEAVRRELKSRFNRKEGYQKDGSIIQIADASSGTLDPSKGDFMTEREVLAREAELKAKMQISNIVRRKFRSSTRRRMLGSDETAKYRAQFKREIEEIEQVQARVQKLAVALDQAESAEIRGVTVNDQFGAMLDGVIKRIDAKYDKADIQEAKHQEYLRLKAAYAEARDLEKQLDRKIDALYPINNTESEAESFSEFKLLGAVMLVQSESWNGKEYRVACAVVWSPKLQERAVKILAAREEVMGKPDPSAKPLEDWLADNETLLPTMVGSRQYIDNEGHLYVVGFAAQEMTDDSAQNEQDRELAATLADQAVVDALYSEGQGTQTAKIGLKKFKGMNPSKVAKRLASDLEMATPKDGIEISGLGKVYEYEGTHEISGKPVYVVVSAVDTAVAAKSSAILKSWYASAVQAVNNSNYLSGERAGMQSEYNAALNSKAHFNQGYRDGKQTVRDEVKAREDAAKPKIPVVAPIPQPQPVQVNKPRQGVTVAPQMGNDDF